MDEQQALEEFTRQLTQASGATQDMIKSLEDAEKGLVKHTKQIGMDLARGIGSMTGSVLNGSKGFDALIPVVEAVGSALGGLVGSIPLFGGATSKFVKGATEASKFLIGQLGKQVQTFNSVSKAGALATDGMTGFSKSAFGSMLTLEQFGRIVTDNSKALAAMSGSAYDGAKMFGDVTSDLAARDDLRLLGLNAEEIAEVTAEFTKQQTRLGRTQGMTAQQLAGSTNTYIKELDVLAKLTGENRRDLQARRAALLQETRFSAMVAGMKEKEAEAVTAAVSMIGVRSERLATGLKDILTSGTATTEEGRQLMLLSGGAARDIGEQLKSGAIDQVQAVNMLKDAIGPNLERFRGLSAILGDSNEVTAGYSDSLKFVTTQTKELAEMYKTQRTQMEGYDPADKGLTMNMAAAQKDIEEFAMNLNKMILDLMPETASITEKLTTILKDVSELAKNGFTLENKNIFQKVMALFGLDKESVAERMGAPVNGTAQEKEAYLKKNPVPKRTGSVSEALVDSMDQFATGGIARYSNQGQVAMLHGTEAVVPLPDGKSIPISINQSVEGMKDLMTAGAPITDNARMLELLLQPQRVAGINQPTLPSNINADVLAPAVATAVNEVQTQTKPSESANTELLETLNRQVADLVRLSARQLNVSQQTRSQLM